MNKITKRIVAGVSAAALLVSAVGVDQLADLFMKTSYAMYNSKTAKSTGFTNLEQDTSGEYYNTGYGLHTNKTATALDDGRTFDVNLESWYVGENPVDVATILDASGSMAWTVDTLEPLTFDKKSMDIDIDAFAKEYGIDEDDLAKYTEYDDKLTKVLAAIQDKDENGGYLPQEIVDKILKPEKTDNSKLSYADYMYYIYESRSTVSEFVPLGYWDGGESADVFNPIGYYPFNGTLENKVNGGNAKYITQESGTFNTDEQVTSVPVEFSSNGLDLYNTDKNGNVVIDISSLKGQDFSLSFSVKFGEHGSSQYNTPLVYVGNASGNKFYSLFRGNVNSSGGGNANNFRVVANNGDTSPKTSSAIKSGNEKDWLDCSLKFEWNEDGYIGSCTANKQSPATSGDTTFNSFKFGTDDKLYLILGGNELLQYSDDGTDISNNYIKNLVITSESKEVANFPLNSNLKNSIEGSDIKAELMENAADGSSVFNVTNNVAPTTMNAKFNKGGLDLNETAKDGAVLLDVMPTADEYTISFQVMISNTDNTTGTGNILYVGDNSREKYYTLFRGNESSRHHIKIQEKDDTNNHTAYNNIFSGAANEWKKVTLVVKDSTVTFYGDNAQSQYTLDLDYGKDQLSIILAGLWNDAYNRDDLFVKNLYVFDEALDATQVELVYNNIGNTEFAILPSALSGSGTCGGYHATTSDGKDIAQISESLAQNTNDEERRGWYYVNSHSNWADISGCLESGKQYLGIINDFGLATYKDGITPDKLAPNGSGSGTVNTPEEGYADDNQSIATVPSVYQAAYDDYEKATATNPDIKPGEALGSTERAKYLEYYKNLTKGNDSTRKFTPAENERSLQFYIDNYGYLRCFYCTGDYSWKVSSSKWSYNPRTFCSVVYVKEKYDVNKRIKGEEDYGNPTKYEELNYALNQFYQNLAKYSDLSNSAIVRFSTHNLIQGNSKDEVETNAVDHLKMLIMKDWTNWSDKYIDSNKELTYDKYLQDLLIPTADETSIRTENSSARPDILEYPYVMTGGTYTWTGLKAFYDNMVNTDKLSSGDTVYNIANDARDKYLIIFTDGRDNLVDNTKDKKYVTNFGYKDGNAQKGVEYYGNFAPYYNGVQKNLNYDSELAKAWADKLKDEGYTIFCVMLATGSISPTTNEEEYNKAYKFLETLAGDKDGERDVDDCISVVGVDNTLEEAFADILTQIQLPRNDYTVQDYIDPRFDLVDKDGNLYKLGAGGKITVTKDGEAVESLTTLTGTTTGTVSGNTVTVENIIDKIDKKEAAIGLAYTPRESYMVNRKADSSSDDGYDTGNIGTGYIYYDDVKDMYYLRWTDQIIPMENEAFDTAIDHKNLDVWSATIRLKAKDDFIGGNNILTNGNEAGENLVYSDATIENMTDNPTLYFTEDELKDYKVEGKDGEYNVPYRVKLCRLSGTDRKINAVDAGGVSQAVYGNGIDIPSSGFPRTTVNVRLLPLDANDLNDVIYMGEVVSPTMMLADLENGYMTGSYYLQYLERYAYRVYGTEADKMPLIELLNKWLKINEEEVEAKTFTIPYIYLPDPEYGEDGKLARDAATSKVNIQNSTGASWKENDIDFTDLNLCDVTGFITYTWKRSDGQYELQQQMDSDPSKYDITKDYVVKNTKQIKYNLQLTFTPLKEGELPTGFSLGDNFISEDKFFTITDGEFDKSSENKWTITSGTNSNRADYLQAMIYEERTYTPHVMYNADAAGGKWVLVDETIEGFTSADAITAYTKDGQTEAGADGKTVTDHGVYDWTPDYKPASGKAQLEGGTAVDDVKNIKGFYTDTPDNVKMLNAGGVEITDDDGAITVDAEPVSLAANTTYIKDVVNAALALELFVDGKYLNQTDPIIKVGKTFTFIARRSYEDPYNEPSYATEKIGADAREQKYKLTFTVKEIPADTQPNEIYRVWATLTNVEVEGVKEYIPINTKTTDTSYDETIKSYLGYEKADALPIGSYLIWEGSIMDNNLKTDPFQIGADTLGNPVYFEYLKVDNDHKSYTYNRFPESVSKVSADAATDTKDGKYQIWNGTTDNSSKNIAQNARAALAPSSEVEFYFGTTDGSGEKGVNRIKDPENDYAKDRLGIIMLSASTNSLAITKEVKNTNAEDNKNHEWDFTVTIETDDSEWAGTHAGGDLDYTLYNFEGGTWVADTTTHNAKYTITEAGGKYTLTITGVKVKHNQKAVFSGLPEGTWKVTEDLGGVFCTPHNDQFTYGEDEWQYNRADSTRADIDLTPASQVNYINEFPYELPSAGGSGTVRYILLGTLLTALGALLFAVLYYDRKKARR